jgi:predicted SnoaL-like aldol condensation-catalyzing enzyme
MTNFGDGEKMNVAFATKVFKNKPINSTRNYKQGDQMSL